MGQDRTRGHGRLARWSRRWPLLAQPVPLVGYVTVVIACDLALIGWELTRNRPHPGDLLLFGALLICGALCIEATRRLGDRVLAALAGVLSQHVRDGDVAGRFGGEEFVVLLPGAEPAEAVKVAERLREQAAAMAVPAGDAVVAITVSIGGATLGVHGTDLQGLLAAADLALYRAKAGGRNQVCLPARPEPVPAEDSPIPA